MEEKKYKATLKDWILGITLCVLYIVFLIWIRSWWGIIVLPFIFDAYVTRKINWGWWKDIENPVTRTVMSWVDAIVFALVAVYFVNIYFFQNYTIPSSSLEKSLLVGDYLFVSKMSYGPRVPQTPLHMPLCQHTLPIGGIKSYIEWPQWKYKRVTPKRVSLNDIVVFNYPAGDSVALNTKYQNSDYYMMCYVYGQQLYAEQYGQVQLDSMDALAQRRYYERCYSLGSGYIKSMPSEYGQVGSRPVDRRENYVKRCVGLPGQTIEVRNRIVYLDGKPNKEPDNVQYNYRIELIDRLPDDLVRQLGISGDDLVRLYQQGSCPLTKAARQQLAKRTDLVASITLEEQDDTRGMLYPLNANTGWTSDNYGPLWIPAKGESIKLTLDNLPMYERPIRVYEGNDLEVTDDGRILINGKECNEYTFQMDYYWMQGDNRHNSADSRFWGFVPEDHVVGKPIIIWWSKSPDYGLLEGGVRWSRIFRWVDNIK